MSQIPPNPKRRYAIEIYAAGDTWDDALYMLRELYLRVKDDGPACRSVIGGCNSGGSAEVKHDPDMTHDKYVEALEARREAKQLASN